MSNSRADLKKAVEFLRASGFLKYGQTIPTKLIEDLIGMKADNSWEWRGSYLSLKKAIEDEGFFCTQRGQYEQDLHIIKADSMWLHAKKRELNRKKATERDLDIVQKTDINTLDDHARRLHLHQMNRLAIIKFKLDDIVV